MSEVPGTRAPEATALDVPAGSEFDQQREDEETTLAPLQDTQVPDSVPQVPAPEPDDLRSLDDANTATVTAPETGTADAALAAPDAQQDNADLDVEGEEPVLPNPQAVAPVAPVSEEDLSISTVPAQPTLPEAEESAFPTPPDVTEEAGPETEDAAPAVEETQEQSAPVPEPETTDETTADPVEEPQTEAQTDAQADIETDTEAEPAPTAPTPSDEATEPDAAAEPDTAAPQAAEDEGSDPEVTTATAPELQDTAPEAAEPPAPASTIGDLAPGVTTNRLPSVGADATTDEAAVPDADDTAPQEETTPEAQAETDPLPPIARFAAPFDNPEDKPLMSIVLIDDGTSPIGPSALADFPYPISFAVDATHPDAAQTAQAYRDAGLEVLAIADLPDTASPQDAEVAIAATLRAVPEAVAVMEGTQTGLQGSRAAAEQLAPILLDSGHGLVMFPNGLDTIQKLIAREGVPAATVFRDFDSEGQNATIIRRFLDQAAFRAGQEEGGVIMVGRLRPDTISALLLWGLQDRAASVALAPVSAVLTAE